MSAELHRFGRKALLAAWRLVTGEEPSIAELQIAGAVANLESAYGRAPFTNRVTGESRVINNWGALQAGKPPCDEATSFEATDTSPLKVTDDNPRGEYQACFRMFADGDPRAPAALLREITVRRPESWAAMKAGDIDAFSTEMHTRHGHVGAYYEGFGATAEAQIDHHAHAVEAGVQAIAEAMGEDIEATRGGPTLTVGDVAFGCGVGGVALLLWHFLRGGL